MNNNPNHQYDGIQALRFFAALLVVITHSYLYASIRLGTHKYDWGFGSKGVDIFFIISGFVMIVSSRKLVNEADGWLKFALQRLTRVVPLYWLATSIKVGATFFGNEYMQHSTLDVITIIQSYFFIPYYKGPGLIEPLVGVGWTLVFEMFFYLVFTLALFIRLNLYIFTGIIMFSLAFLSHFRPDDHPAWMFLFDPIVLEFWFGMILGYLALNRKLITVYLAVPALILSVLLIFLDSLSGLPRPITNGFPACLLVYAVISLEMYIRDKIPKFILFMGAASYSLYLFHPLFAPLAPVILRKLNLPIFGLSVAISIIIAITVAIFMYLFVELKITHFFRKLPILARFTHKPIVEESR